MKIVTKIRCWLGWHKRLDVIKSFGAAQHIGCPDCGKRYAIHHGERAYMTVLAGNKHRNAWLFGLANQALWLIWIVTTGPYGLLPMNAALWVVYARNHLKWSRA